MTFRPTSKLWHPRILFFIFALNAFVYTIFLLHPATFKFVGISHTPRADDELGQQPIPGYSSSTPSLDEGQRTPDLTHPTHDEEDSSSRTSTAAPTSVNSSKEKGKWEFDTARDSKAWGLDEEQCDSAFPGLFTEVDRAVAYRKTLGQVKPEDIDISSEADVATGGVVRVMIKDQQV
jgi:hypothetical protein